MQRVVTADDWPPSVRLRAWLRDHKTIEQRAHPGPGRWLYAYALMTCAWCFGSWTTFIIVASVWHYVPLPLPGLWFPAARVIVGVLGDWEDRGSTHVHAVGVEES
jgi:hypothetical protein